MRFSVAAMIAAIDDVIAGDLAGWEEKRQEREAERANERADWNDQYGAAWSEALKKARVKLVKHIPLVAEDFPTNSNRYLAVFRSQVRDLAPFKPDPDLLALQVVLRTIADDTVSTAGLRDVGVTSATLRRVVQAMGPKTIAR